MKKSFKNLLRSRRFKLSFYLMLILFSCVQCKTKELSYGIVDTSNSKTQIPLKVQPLLDYWMRDTWIILGEDDYYYMTGTTVDPNRKFTGQPHCWDWNDGVYLFRSKDLKNWEHLGLIWSIERDGTWQKYPKIYSDYDNYPRKSVNGDSLDNFFRAVWAPEIHYIKKLKNWFIVACMNNSAVGPGSFILKSTTGKPEGPYVNITGNDTKPLFKEIDGSLFEDTDGSVYFVGHNHYIAKMKSDMSGLAEEIKTLKETPYSPEPYIEGAFIFKHDKKYHLVQAIWSHKLLDGKYTYCPAKESDKTRFSYDCVISTANDVHGPYSQRYTALTGGGHNNLFEDKNGQWWATIFFNPRGMQAKKFKVTCRPGIVPMKYVDGCFYPEPERLK
jgi:beta-xylosidase